MFYGERTIEVHGNHSDLLAVGVQMVDCLAGCLCCRAHEDNHPVGIFCSIVREQMVFPSCNLADFLEILLNHFRHVVVVVVGCFAVCEEGLRVLCRSSCNGALGTHGAVAETLHVVIAHERTDIFHVNPFNLMIFV